MKQLAATLVLLTVFLAASAKAEWYAVKGVTNPASHRIEGDQLVTRIPLRKVDVPVASVTLSRSGDYLGKYVVEVTLTRQLDSGDGYILSFGDTVVGEIKTRGNWWVFGFDSVELARKCIDHLRDHHRLKANDVLDTTRS